MAEEIINFDELKRRMKLESKRAWVREKTQKIGEDLEKVWDAGVNYCQEHPKEALIAGMAILGYVNKNKKVNIQKAKLKAEEHRKKFEVYDHQTKRYIPIRREMTQGEIREYERRRRNKEGTVQILWEMGLLK